jgi:hypothetical protein
LGQDLYVANFVDLDPGPGVRDWSCGTRTYDGHTGIDVTIRGFPEQEIGVPVFAAADGVVREVQRVASDYSYGTNTQPFDNHVVIDHGGGREIVYGHLERASISVAVGEWVSAGAQIGETASSGNSSGPHLHLTVRDGGNPLEPWAGACRAGASLWTGQPAIGDAPYVRDVALGGSPFSGRADLPFDDSKHTGTFVLGRRSVSVRVEVLNGERANSERFTVIRPDGSLARDDARPSSLAWRQATTSRMYTLDVDVPGRWRIVYELDGQALATAPFDVGTAASPIADRPPAPVRVELAPQAPNTEDVPVCLVRSPLVARDPDYDLVRYRFRWTVGGKLARRVTSAALSDALPHRLAEPGETIRCEVTPSDGRRSAPAATATAHVR